MPQYKRGANVTRVLDLPSPLLVAFFLDGVGEAEIQGEVLLGDSQLHLHQEDSVVVGEDLVYFSL